MGHQDFFLPLNKLQTLVDRVSAAGYQCYGPHIRDAAIVFAAFSSVEQWPVGVVDFQGPGEYRLESETSGRYFYWANGPQGLKPLTFFPEQDLWQSTRTADATVDFHAETGSPQKMAVFGVRSCDLAALALLDRHFLSESPADPYYRDGRERLLLIAVNCARSAATCFCHSTGDGPFAESGFDLCLTELEAGFLIVAGSDRGTELIDALRLRLAHKHELKQKREQFQIASRQQRKLDPVQVRFDLAQSIQSDAWQEIARDCLSCGNCTSVCPTCFCFSEMDRPALGGENSMRTRIWDSCFSHGHSYIHGVTIREETAPRYRQWLTHKFSTWVNQYGRSGCVGCGRCITWCPAGIDVIESIRQVSANTHE
ncbi:MAG: 4Fe-4S dicluster domain-containing protein [gamma proteobacterium symbiont of Bathyaustriella thionipta]|nr:4Fe-4S dicluster domain-containing protein [gamma proteobacterium symbiont of Bathyaustriella thionipta]